MSVEKLVQNLKTDDAQLIADSMSTLIKMINDSSRIQEEIIKYLPGKDILKIMACLDDSNSYLRKLTAKFFLSLVYGNYVVQQVFCDILGIIPSDGKICINKIPDSFKNITRALPDCLETLRRTHPEELREEIPFCWYFGLQHAELTEKKVDFFSKNETSNIDNFIDPAHFMLGFVMRNPRKFQERMEQAKKTGVVGSSRYNNSANNSLDQSVNRSINKYHSPMRGSIGKSPVFSSRYANGRSAKGTSAVSQSLCKTERLVTNELDGSVERDELTYKSIERDLNTDLHRYEDKPKTADIKHKKSQPGDLSIEDNYHNSKLMGSMNESQDMNQRLLETSLNNSVSAKNALLKTDNKSPNVTYTEIKLGSGNIKSVSNSVAISTSTKVSSSRDGGSKKSDTVAKKIAEKVEKVERAGQIMTNSAATPSNKPKTSQGDRNLKISAEPKEMYSVSAISTPKNNILSKILKEKPLIKETLYSNKPSTAKAKKEDTLKLNTSATPTSTTITSSTTPKVSSKPQTAVGGSNYNKAKTDNEYVSKKHAFHSSLLKSIDATDRSGLLVQTEETLESHRESINKENLTMKTESSRPKTYHISATFKSPAGTPRVANDSLKSNLSNNSKILNPRKSHDISYLTKNKKKSDDMTVGNGSKKN